MRGAISPSPIHLHGAGYVFFSWCLGIGTLPCNQSSQNKVVFWVIAPYSLVVGNQRFVARVRLNNRENHDSLSPP
jgi:hypothetical protein